MAMALPLTLGTVFGPNGWWTRLWNLAAAPILVWTVYVTNSRGGMLALAAAMLFFFGRRLGKWGLIVGAVAALGLFTFGPSRMSQMSSDEESAQGRVLAWESGLEMLGHSPLWGVGKGEFLSYHSLTAHNSLVLCMAELGLLGTACWIGLFYFAFRDSRRMTVPTDGRSREGDEELNPIGITPVRSLAARFASTADLSLQVSLIAFLIGGFFLSRTYTPPLYVYLALTVAAARVVAARSGTTVAPAEARDWLSIAGLALAGPVVVQILVRLWG
jgi:O-antigen ligase